MSAPREQTYGYANVGRFGLAHSLLAWARCELWCHDHNAPVVAPNWLQFRLGPYLRNERDKRRYHLLFNSPDHIHGLRRLYLLGTLPRVVAEDVDLSKSLPGRAPRLLVFNNSASGIENGYFPAIIGREKIVRAALVRMTRPQFIPAAPVGPVIGIHVRMGDFLRNVSSDELRNGKRNARLPISWYISRLMELREKLGACVPAQVFSDGTEEELAPLCSMESVTRIKPKTAISDMLALSSATVLITAQGLGLWGSYLGHVPRVCHPGQRFMCVLGNTGGLDLEPECDDDRPLSPDFIRVVGERLTAATKSSYE